MGCNCTKPSLNVNNVKYVILDKIADGGFGTIELVEEANSGRRYALKRVKCTDRKDLEQKSVENKYLKQLNDQSINIIRLIADDVANDSGGGFVLLSVMPFYRNGTLQDELERNLSRGEFIRADRLIALLKGICDGLKCIHDANLAHRDLKPHNVLIGDDRKTPVLTDFGSMTERLILVESSRRAQEIQEWADQNCSMYYKAPELFEPKVNSTISDRADIWSLGCLLHAIMFNKGPFDYVAERGDSILLAVTNGRIQIQANDTSQHPIYLINIIKRALLIEPSERITLAQILSDILANQPDDLEQINIA